MRQVLCINDLEPTAFCVNANGLLEPTATGGGAGDTSVLTQTLTVGNQIATHSPDGTTAATPILESVTTLTDAAATAIGGNTINFTNEAGAIVNFCEGFDSHAENTNCTQAFVPTELGIGDGMMVKDVTMNGKEINIHSAPEHGFDYDTVGASLGASPSVTAGNEHRFPQIDFTYTNTSCRNVTGLLMVEYDGRYVSEAPDTDVRLLCRASDGGAPVVNSMSGSGARFSDLIDGQTIAARQVNPWEPFTLAPGATHTSSYILDFDVLAGQASVVTTSFRLHVLIGTRGAL